MTDRRYRGEGEGVCNPLDASAPSFRFFKSVDEAGCVRALGRRLSNEKDGRSRLRTSASVRNFKKVHGS